MKERDQNRLEEKEEELYEFLKNFNEEIEDRSHVDEVSEDTPYVDEVIEDSRREEEQQQVVDKMLEDILYVEEEQFDFLLDFDCDVDSSFWIRPRLVAKRT
jgi:hypothetical protein